MLYAALATFALAAISIPSLAGWARRRNYLDLPNDRSLHVVATPRIGGVAIVLSVLLGAAVLNVAGVALGRHAAIVLMGAAAVALLGFADDLRPLPPVARLAAQTLVSLSVTWIIAARSPSLATGAGWAAQLLVVFWIVGLINAYNFMDGVDGIAGLQAVVAGAGWMLVGLLAGYPAIAALGLLIAAASAGFLLHNWHPARVFMGDAGSGFLGSMFAALPLLAPDGPRAVWWCSALLVWPFILDTGFTLLCRVRRGENLLQAHRSHVYQRFVLTGWSHRRITIVYGGLAVLGIPSAVSILLGHPGASLLSGLAIVIAAGTLWWTVNIREAESASGRGALG